MKKSISTFVFSLVTLPLVAELNTTDYKSQTILSKQPSQVEECEGPFSISAFVDASGKAKAEHKHCKPNYHDSQFLKAEVDTSFIYYYVPCYKEGLLTTLSYSYTKINWDNPFFNQHHFNTVSFGLGAFTHRLEQWTWEALVRCNADVDYNFKWADYLNFDITLYGRYTLTDWLGFNVGFIALTGMKIDHLYPIIGLDWTISDNWKLNLVFPINISLIYILTPEWSLGIAGRSYEERHRVGKHNHYSRGTVEYYASGAEGGVYYASLDKSLQANFHLGGFFSNMIKVARRKHNHSHRIHFGSSPYLGGDIAYRF